MTADEAKQALTQDEEVAKRIHKLAHELELAVQEATNRGLCVEQNQTHCGMLHYPSRPIDFTIRRRVNL